MRPDGPLTRRQTLAGLALAGLPVNAQRRQTKEKRAMNPIQLIWSTRTNVPTPEVYFMLAPGLGLTDIDMKRVTNASWKNLRAASEKSVASLAVSPETKMEELQGAIELIATQGAYQFVVVGIRKL